MDAGAFKVSLQGFEELAEALQRFPKASAEVLASAVIQGALVVQDDAQRRVPVKTGNLKRSIHAEFEEQTPTSASAVVGTDVEYGKYVEFGTRHMSARPFLRPALDENHDEVVKQITDAFVELANEELDNRGPRGGVRKS